MADVALKPWTPDIDPATIPDEVLKSERGRRNAGRRQSYTGGVVWARHNPRLENSGCRCQKCIDRRALENNPAKAGRMECYRCGGRIGDAAYFVTMDGTVRHDPTCGEK